MVRLVEIDPSLRMRTVGGLVIASFSMYHPSILDNPKALRQAAEGLRKELDDFATKFESGQVSF